MPEMDGIALASAIRNNPMLARNRLVLLTSVGGRGEDNRARSAGVDAYLTKPVHQSQLFERLCTVMGPETRQPAQPVLLRSAAHANTPEPQEHMRVLVAEDNTVNQKLLVRLLEKIGYSAEVTKNGIEALTALSQSEYAAVLMDCQMPEMNGFTTTEAIRHYDQEKGTHTPIIAVTAYERPGDRERCLVAGMDDYLAKPIKLKELQEALDRLVIPRPRTTRVSPAQVEVSSAVPLSSPSANEATEPEVAVPVVQVPVAPQRIPTATRLLVAEDNPVNQKLIVRLGFVAEIVTETHCR
jgi:two-component system sensor histidine kinase/response regulator